jgi:hypothetical protein
VTALGLVTIVLLVLVVVLLAAVLIRLRALEDDLARALRRRRRTAPSGHGVRAAAGAPRHPAKE